MLKTKKHLFQTLLTTAAATMLCASAQAGFYTDGATLIDDNGNAFVMRGVNHPHAWYTHQTSQAIADIAATGANSVRVVLSSGHRWSRTPASEVQTIIDLCKANNLVAVLEVHDTTGYGEESSAQTLAGATDYWLDIARVLQGEESYVIINIGNEPFGNGASASDWVNAHSSAITRLRNAGLDHTFMVDAPNWGQDWQNLMRSNAPVVVAADPNHNVVFSVHMYEVYDTASKVQNYISGFVADGLPLVVGEFAADHYGSEVAEGAILQAGETYGVGYLGWSWSGNSSNLASLDIVQNFNAANLTSWGQTLLNSANGIANTSNIATVYTGGGGNNGGGSSSCGTHNGYPVCCDASSDPDGDGWGWENSQSCVVTSQTGGGSSAGTCDWYGSIYPVCQNTQSGWGWENNQSCISQSTCNSQ